MSKPPPAKGTGRPGAGHSGLPASGCWQPSDEVTQRFTYFDRNGSLILAGMAFGAGAVGLFKLAEWFLGW